MIKDITQLDFPSYATLTSATVSMSDMGEKTITSDIRIDGNIVPNFSRDWNVMFRGERYVMSQRKPQASKDNENLDSIVSLTFEHWAQRELKRYFFAEMTSVSSGTAIADSYVASVSLSLPDFCSLLSKVLYYYFGDRIAVKLAGSGYSSDPVTVEISYSYIWDVLVKLYELYGVRWDLQSERTSDGSERCIIVIDGGASQLGHILEYGFDGGLLKVERQVQNSDIRNIMLGRGGEKNLPYRYFKDIDEKNDSFPADPDWIPELAKVHFDRLHGASFRDYVRGWKTNPRRQGGSPDPYDSDLGSRNWAYFKGHTDEKFVPVEYVADALCVADSGIVPVPGSSIAEYGEMWGALDDSEDIFPTIQGVYSADHRDYFRSDIGRIDEVVAVERILSDDVADSTAEKAVVTSQPSVSAHQKSIPPGISVHLTAAGREFTVDPGKAANLTYGESVVKTVGGVDDSMVVKSVSVLVRDAENPSKTNSATGIPPGRWSFEVVWEIQNTGHKTAGVQVELGGIKVQTGSPESLWGNVFNIWIKNIWASERKSDESDEDYVERVWRPILGDREGNEAKVVFSDGWLSTSEDYEFTIVKGGVAYDTGKSLNGVDSHWRLTLAKSDADLESTGLYVPSVSRNAEAGNHFFFIGIDMPHAYVLWAEQRLDLLKLDHLKTVSNVKPTWVVALDPIRASMHVDSARSLVEQLTPGSIVRLADKRFIKGAPEKLYVQQVTLTYNEPSSDDAALIPDIEVVLGDQWAASGSVVSTLQGDIDKLSRQFGSLTAIENAVRLIGDKLYLRKDGLSDRSVSPTEFGSLVTSVGFRQGMTGGAGWGIFRDSQGNSHLEVDCINVRRQMQVNELVINQISARGGMIVESAAAIEVSAVLRTADGWRCFFDQKEGSVVNQFRVGDIALCHRFNPDALSSDPTNALKYYRCEVTSVGANYISLASNGKNGDSEPSAGDVIVQYGSVSDPERRYVVVRDVVGGGYERYIEGLDKTDATGTEYYFAGRQSGSYANRPRFFIGDEGSYLEYVDGTIRFKGVISSEALVDDKRMDEFIDYAVLREVAKIQGGGVNLLRNSDFRSDFDDFWNVEAYSGSTWRVASSRQSKLGNANKTIEVVLGKDGGMVDIQQQISGLDLSEPRRFTLSMDAGPVFIDDVGTAKVTAALGVIYSVGDMGFGSAAEFGVLTESAPHRGRRLSATADISIPPDAKIDSVTLMISIQGSGNIYIGSPMLELGGINAGWAPSPLDNIYLREALKGTTTIAGGLVLTSLIKLGTTSDDGSFNVMSGINGVVDTSARGSGIAIWSGGDQVDAVDKGSGARFAIRHDGTGYASGGMIKFNSDHVAVGKETLIKLYGNGLFMYKDNLPVLQMSNTPVAASALESASPKKVTDVSHSQNVTISTQGYTFTSTNPKEYPLGDTTIKKGAVLTVDITVLIDAFVGGSPAEFAHKYPMPYVKLSLRKQGALSDTAVVAREQMALLLGNDHTRAIVRHDFVIPSDGVWAIVLSIENPNGGGPMYAKQAKMTVSGTLTVTTSLTERTLFGNNGVSIVFGDCTFVVRDGYFGARAGKMVLEMNDDVGLRVSKNSGASWEALVRP